MLYITVADFCASKFDCATPVDQAMLKRLQKKGAAGWGDGVLYEDIPGAHVFRWVVLDGCLRHIESDVAQEAIQRWAMTQERKRDEEEEEVIVMPPPEREAPWERSFRLNQEVKELVDAKRRELERRHESLTDEEFEVAWLDFLRYDPPIEGDDGLWRNTKDIKLLDEAAPYGAARWDTSPVKEGQVRLLYFDSAQTRTGWSAIKAVVRVWGEAPLPDGWKKDWLVPEGGFVWVERLSSYRPVGFPAQMSERHRVMARELIPQRWGEPGFGASIVRRGLDALGEAELARRGPGPTPGHRES